MKRIWNKEKIVEKINELSKDFGHQPTKYEVGSLYSISRIYFGSWANALRTAGYKIKHLQKIQLPKDTTKSLAYFIGVVLADGHIVYKKQGKYAVKIYTSYENEKHIILHLIKSLFNYIPHVRTRKYGFNKLPNYEITISSKELVKFLLDEFGIPFGKKSGKIRVPENLRNDVLFFDLLRGVIDGDGGVSYNGVSVYSSSKEFLSDIKDILLRFKIKTWNISKSTKTVWYLTVPIAESFKLHKRLYKRCEFFYPKLKDSWETNLLMYDRPNVSNPLPSSNPIGE